MRGVRWHVKPFLLRLFTVPGEPSRFASSIVTPWGYKPSLVAPAQHTSSCMTSQHFTTSFTTAEKKEKIEKYI
jgi:hypothetical protein